MTCPRATLCAVLLVALIALPGAARADTVADGREAPLVTDRPTFGVGPLTVGALRFQLETGVDVGFTPDGDTTALTLPTKLRFGIWGDLLELHLESPTLVYLSSDVLGDFVGLAPLDVGFKIRPIEGDGFTPALGLFVSLTVPSGAGDTGEGPWALTSVLAASWTAGAFSPWINLGFTNVLADRDNGADTLRAALGVSWSVTGLEDLALFAEIFSLAAIDGSSNPPLFIDGGATYLITPSFQIDIYARGGLVNSTEAVGGGLGVGWRL